MYKEAAEVIGSVPPSVSNFSSKYLGNFFYLIIKREHPESSILRAKYQVHTEKYAKFNHKFCSPLKKKGLVPH